MTFAIAVLASETTMEARSLIGISSSRIAGGISGRTSRMRRSSVRRNMMWLRARAHEPGELLVEIIPDAVFHPAAGQRGRPVGGHPDRPRRQLLGRRAPAAGRRFGLRCGECAHQAGGENPDVSTDYPDARHLRAGD